MSPAPDALQLLDEIERWCPEAHTACAALRVRLGLLGRQLVDLRAEVSAWARDDSRHLSALLAIVGTPAPAGLDVWAWVLGEVTRRVDQPRAPCGCDRCGRMPARVLRSEDEP